MADMDSTYFIWVLQVLAAKNLRIWKFQDGILLQEFANIATFVDDQNDSQEEYIRYAKLQRWLLVTVEDSLMFNCR